MVSFVCLSVGRPAKVHCAFVPVLIIPFIQVQYLVLSNPRTLNLFVLMHCTLYKLLRIDHWTAKRTIHSGPPTGKAPTSPLSPTPICLFIFFAFSLYDEIIFSRPLPAKISWGSALPAFPSQSHIALSLSESVLSPLHSIPLHPGPYQTIHPTHLIRIAYPKPHVPSPPISPSASQNRYSRARTPRVQTTLAALHETSPAFSPHTSGPTFDHSLWRPSRCLAIPCISRSPSTYSLTRSGCPTQEKQSNGTTLEIYLPIYLSIALG